MRARGSSSTAATPIGSPPHAIGSPRAGSTSRVSAFDAADAQAAHRGRCSGRAAARPDRHPRQQRRRQSPRTRRATSPGMSCTSTGALPRRIDEDSLAACRGPSYEASSRASTRPSGWRKGCLYGYNCVLQSGNSLHRAFPLRTSGAGARKDPARNEEPSFRSHTPWPPSPPPRRAPRPCSCSRPRRPRCWRSPTAPCSAGARSVRSALRWARSCSTPR